MTVFDLEYKLFQWLRKLRVWFKRKLTGPVVIRYVSAAVIAVNIFFNNLPSPNQSTNFASSEETAVGTVLSQKTVVKIPTPVRVGDPNLLPGFLGKAALVVDATSSAVLFEKNSTEKLPPASLTKLMTALLVLENKPLDRAVAVLEPCTKVDGLKVGFKAGQNYTIESLLSALLLPSASDAACALVSAVEENSASPSAGFVGRMNARAVSLGLVNTNFVNASGLDSSNGDHYSTTADLMVLVGESLKYFPIRDIVSRANQKISDVTGAAVFDLKNTNELLTRDPGFRGVKTGYTPKALGCLAFLYERDGRQISGVILGSPDRFGDAERLVNWVFENYRWE